MNEPLMNIIRFDQQDLYENRKGLLSQRQKLKLMKGAKILLIVMIIFSVLLAGLIYLVSDKPLTNGQYIAMGIVAFLFIGFGIFFYFRSKIGARRGIAKRVTGRISFRMYRSMRYLLVKEAKKQFPAGGLTEKYFQPDVQYHVYYSETTTDIVSIEKADL